MTDSNSTNWISLLSQGVFTFLGAFAGAFFAYLFDKYRERTPLKNWIKEYSLRWSESQNEFLQSGNSPNVLLDEVILHIDSIRNRLLKLNLSGGETYQITDDELRVIASKLELIPLPNGIGPFYEKAIGFLPRNTIRALQKHWEYVILHQKSVDLYNSYFNEYVFPLYIQSSRKFGERENNILKYYKVLIEETQKRQKDLMESNKKLLEILGE
jgi:hypothetical protein